MATYNGSKYIQEQVNSILIQITESDEIIVSDDCSTDETLDIINSINDKRVKVFKNKTRLGYTKNFEKAISLSSGDIIFLSDQDDIWLNNKVVTCLNKLESCDFVVHDALIVDLDRNVICSSYFKARGTGKGFVHNFYKIGYLGCCMAFKRKILRMAMPIPDLPNIITHDSWISLISEMGFRTDLIDTPLIEYRRHQNNTSNGGQSKELSIFNAYHVFNIRVLSSLLLISRWFKTRFFL